MTFRHPKAVAFINKLDEHTLLFAPSRLEMEARELIMELGEYPDVNPILDYLNDLRNNAMLSYADYSQLHDMVSELGYPKKEPQVATITVTVINRDTAKKTTTPNGAVVGYPKVDVHDVLVMQDDEFKAWLETWQTDSAMGNMFMVERVLR